MNVLRFIVILCRGSSVRPIYAARLLLFVSLPAISHFVPCMFSSIVSQGFTSRCTINSLLLCPPPPQSLAPWDGWPRLHVPNIRQGCGEGALAASPHSV